MSVFITRPVRVDANKFKKMLKSIGRYEEWEREYEHLKGVMHRAEGETEEDCRIRAWCIAAQQVMETEQTIAEGRINWSHDFGDLDTSQEGIARAVAWVAENINKPAKDLSFPNGVTAGLFEAYTKTPKDKAEFFRTIFVKLVPTKLETEAKMSQEDDDAYKDLNIEKQISDMLGENIAS